MQAGYVPRRSRQRFANQPSGSFDVTCSAKFVINSSQVRP
jgi:hypothetical protein